MSSMMPDSLAQGRYQLGQSIGHGGMAEVYVALDTRLGRTVLLARGAGKLRLPAREVGFVDALLVERARDAHDAVHTLRIEASQLAALDTDGLRIVAAHEEDFARAVLARMRADPFDGDASTDERIGRRQQVVDLQHGRLLRSRRLRSGFFRGIAAAGDARQHAAQQQRTGKREYDSFHFHQNFLGLTPQRYGKVLRPSIPKIEDICRTEIPDRGEATADNTKRNILSCNDLPAANTASHPIYRDLGIAAPGRAA